MKQKKQQCTSRTIHGLELKKKTGKKKVKMKKKVRDSKRVKEDGKAFYCVDAADDDGYKGKGREREELVEKIEREIKREGEMRMPRATCCSSLRSLSLSLKVS